MNIRLKTVCPEQLGRLPDGEYEVPDGCTALQALIACMAAAEAPTLPAAQLEKLVYMRNSRHVKPDEPLTAGDRLMVLRPLTGG
jgi:molybdopterin converting factor small subunit